MQKKIRILTTAVIRAFEKPEVSRGYRRIGRLQVIQARSLVELAESHKQDGTVPVIALLKSEEPPDPGLGLLDRERFRGYPQNLTREAA